MEDKFNEIKYEQDYERMRCRGLQIVDYDLYKTTSKTYIQLLFVVVVIFLLLGMFGGYKLGIEEGIALGIIAG